MKNAYKVILSPMITEKNNDLASQEKYVFKVAKDAGKIEIGQAVEELFDVIAPKVAEREGGYTRVIKTDFRRGDGGSNAMIELVDWADDQTGAVTINQAKKKAREERAKEIAARNTVATKKEEAPAPVEEAPAEEAAAPVEETPAEEKAE